MAEISEGQGDRTTFMQDVCENVNELITAIKNATAPTPERILQSDSPVLGQCPICGASVREHGDGRLYTCDTGRNCSFVVYGEIASRKISKRMVRQLLKGEKHKKSKVLNPKTGKAFEAALKLNDEGKALFVFSPSSSNTKTDKASNSSTNNKMKTSATTSKARKQAKQMKSFLPYQKN